MVKLEEEVKRLKQGGGGGGQEEDKLRSELRVGGEGLLMIFALTFIK